MSNFILYAPASQRELYQCCFSLLKLLEVYNLKPPPGLVPAVCTGQPALVEGFTTFFDDFRILDPCNEAMLEGAGKVIRPLPDEYPVGPVDALFSGAPSAPVLATYRDIPHFPELLEALLRKYQEESIPNQVKRVHALPIARIREESRRYAGLPLPQRWLRRLMGREWSVRRTVEKL